MTPTDTTIFQNGIIGLTIKTNGDTIFFYDETRAIFEPVETVRQSDTMSIAFNDEWKRYEPKGQTDLTTLQTYQQSQVVKYPLNPHFKECSFVCATICIAFYIIRITRLLMA